MPQTVAAAGQPRAFVGLRRRREGPNFQRTRRVARLHEGRPRRGNLGRYRRGPARRFGDDAGLSVRYTNIADPTPPLHRPAPACIFAFGTEGGGHHRDAHFVAHPSSMTWPQIRWHRRTRSATVSVTS